MSGQHHAPAALPRERPGTYCTGGWVGARAGLDGCGKCKGFLLHDTATCFGKLETNKHQGDSSTCESNDYYLTSLHFTTPVDTSLPPI
jgi:hypothetical protein